MRLLLFALALGALAATVEPPANPVTAVAFHPTNGELVSGGYGEVLVWDVANSKLDRRIAGLIGRVRAVAFSKDGSKLAVAEGDPGRSGAIRLLDYASGHVLFTLAQEKDECLAVAFSPDGAQVAGGAPDGTVRIWNAADGKLVATLKEQTGWISGIAFSPNGKLLAASSFDRTAQVWTVAGFKPLTRLPENPSGPVNAVAFSPDSISLVLAIGATDAADIERVVRIWRTDIEPLRSTAQLHYSKPVDVGPGVPAALAWSTPARLLVALSDKNIRVLNATGGLLTTMSGDTDWVDSVAANADGTRIASGSGSGAVFIWNGTTGKLLATLK